VLEGVVVVPNIKPPGLVVVALPSVRPAAVVVAVAILN
jgi:hypothetical protein